MKTTAENFFLAIAMILIIAIVAPYKALCYLYRRFCIKVLWKRFHIKSPAYHRWHDRRAKKLQAQLDNARSPYPTF